MIAHYRDHAANERTFLSWVRTAVGIAGFAVIIERLPGDGSHGGAAGPWLLGLSGVLVLLALVRFLVIRRQISARRESERVFVRMEVLFAALLVVLVGAVMVFLYHLA